MKPHTFDFNLLKTVDFVSIKANSNNTSLKSLTELANFKHSINDQKLMYLNNIKLSNSTFNY
jgi:hypothetical protein